MTGNRRLLVTGGAGYLGSVLTQMLLARGRQVVVLDDLTFGDAGLAHLRGNPDLEIIEGDLRDVETVRAALRGVEAVFHIAAIANDPSGDLDTALTRSVNYDSYGPLLEESRRAGSRLFVNASSFSVYGVDATPTMTETDPLNCRREYSQCKADSELLVRSFNSDRFTTVNIRLATLCGWSPRMRFDLVANQLLAEAQLHRRIVIHGGEQQRPQIHLCDVCDLFAVLLDTPPPVIGGEVFNAARENSSITGLAEQARAVVERDGLGDVELEFLPGRVDERSYRVSSAKLARILGFRARRPVRQGMQDIADAYARGEWTDHEAPIHHNVRHLNARLHGASTKL